MKTLALAIALALSAPAHADVIYNWETITASEQSSHIAPLHGKMVFDDAGPYEYGFLCESSRLECNSPNLSSPLLLLEFGGLTYRPRETGNVQYFVDVGDGVHFSPYGTYMNTSYFWLVIETDATGVSTVEHSQLDGTPDYYGGSTGRWVLEQDAAVPLPGTLALLGIGALAITARRRTFA